MEKIKYKNVTLVCCLGNICLFSYNGSSLTAYTKQYFHDIAAYTEGIHRNANVILYYYKNRVQRVEVRRQDKVILFDGIV